jgi:copper chaperone NosL
VRMALATLMALMLAACESRPRGPVGLERDDACASCRMLISEHRYATELIDHGGETYKFDDIACMLRFAHSRGIERSGAKFYVTDYTSGSDWIDASAAYFVRLRSSVSSPMGSGYVAFRDVGSTSGQKEDPLTFDELWVRVVSASATSAVERRKLK